MNSFVLSFVFIAVTKQFSFEMEGEDEKLIFTGRLNKNNQGFILRSYDYMRFHDIILWSILTISMSLIGSLNTGWILLAMSNIFFYAHPSPSDPFVW